MNNKDNDEYIIKAPKKFKKEWIVPTGANVNECPVIMIKLTQKDKEKFNEMDKKLLQDLEKINEETIKKLEKHE